MGGRKDRSDSRLRKLYAFDVNLVAELVFKRENNGTLPLPKDTIHGTYRALAGFDEAGRGALAGPVVVGCVHIPGVIPPGVTSGVVPEIDKIVDLTGVDDSKRLSPKKREEMFQRITNIAQWRIGWASAQEIDHWGIVPAISLAAWRAYSAVGQKIDLLLCDRGIKVGASFLQRGGSFSASHNRNSQKTRTDPEHIPPEISLTKGDSHSLHIAAASIAAKVARDRMMVHLDTIYPDYGFAIHKGYGTVAHRAALRRLGPSPIHRQSFHLGSELVS